MSTSTASCNNETVNKYSNVAQDVTKSDDVKQIMNMLHAPPCEQASAGGGVSFLGGLFGVSAAAGASSGCQNQSVVVDAVYNAQQNIMCSLSSNSVSINSVVSGVQDIHIVNGPTGVMDCKNGLKVGNLMTVDAKVTTQLNQAQKEKITNDLKTAVDTILKSAQETQQVAGAPVEGNQSYQAAIKKSDALFAGTTVQDNITKIVNEISGKQGIYLENNGLITGAQCDFNNTALLQLMANTMLSSTLDSVFDLKTSAASQTTVDSSQASKSTQSDVTGSTIPWQVIIAIGAAIAILLLLVTGFIYSAKMKKENGNGNESNNSSSQDNNKKLTQLSEKLESAANLLKQKAKEPS